MDQMDQTENSPQLTTNLYLGEEILNQLRLKAEERKMSMSALARLLLERGLETLPDRAGFPYEPLACAAERNQDNTETE